MGDRAGPPRVTPDRESVSYVSHELRTPLAVITGYAELLAEDASAQGMDEESRRLVQRIRRSSCDLERLLADVTELVRAATGTPREEPATRIPVRGLATEAWEVTRTLIEGRKATLTPATAAEAAALGADADHWQGEPHAARTAVLAVASYVGRAVQHGIVTLRVEAAPGSGRLALLWQSPGLRVPEGFAASLETPLARLEGLEGSAAWRAGLAAAQAQLARCDGILRIDTTAGLELGVDLPRAP